MVTELPRNAMGNVVKCSVALTGCASNRLAKKQQRPAKSSQVTPFGQNAVSNSMVWFEGGHGFLVRGSRFGGNIDNSAIAPNIARGAGLKRQVQGLAC